MDESENEAPTREFTYPTPELRRRQREALTEALAQNDVGELREHLVRAELLLSEVQARKMGKATSDDARELIRYAERYLGLVILKGQAEGWVETVRDAQRRSLTESRGLPGTGKQRTKDIHPAAKHFRELAEGTNEQFAAAIAAARAGGGLSRADVWRELKRLVEPAEGRPELLRGKRRLNVNHVLRQAIDASGVAPSVESELDWDELDPTRFEEFEDGLRDAMNSLGRLRQRVERRHRRVAQAASETKTSDEERTR